MWAMRVIGERYQGLCGYPFVRSSVHLMESE